MKTHETLMDDESIALTMDGYDDCILGTVERFGLEPIYCYSLDKVIAKLQKDGMTYEEAWEFYEFNMVGAWMGDGSPCFMVSSMEKEKPKAKKKKKK